MKKIEIKCKGADTAKLDDLLEFQGELKSLSESNYKKLKKQIIDLGVSAPFFVWKDDKGQKYLIDGHQRRRTIDKMMAEGFDVPALPIIYVEAKDRAEAKRKLLAITSNYGKVDGQGLYEFMHDAGINLDDIESNFEFSDIDISAFADEFFNEAGAGGEGLTDPDEIPEDVEPVCKLGELWQLGEHRLLCGDCTVEANVERLMDGAKADMVFTDPPYGINAIESSGVLSARYQQYANEEDDSCALKFIKMCIDKDLDIIVFGGNYFSYALPKSTHWLVWDKRGSEMAGGNANGDQSDCEIAWTNLDKKNVKCYKHVWAGWFRAGKKEDELKTKVHPSQKPVGLFVNIFEDYKFKSIFDGFLGSGSTLIACEKTGRKCFGMELDEGYASVIIKRWEDFTGKKAELVVE